MQEAQNQSENILDRIFAEQIRLTYQQLPTLSMSNLLGSIVLAFIMWDKVSTTALIVWLLILFVVIALGSPAIVKFYGEFDRESYNDQFWGRILLLYLFVRAIVWGSGGILFYVPDVLEYQLLLLLFIVGGAGLVAIQAAAYKPAFFTMMYPVLFPVIIRFAMDLDGLHIAIALLTFMYGVALAYFYQNIHQTIEESLILRFDKASLAEKLATQKQAAEKAYKDKTRFIASVSHDLRQPLHAQGLFIEELQYRIKDSETKAIVEKLNTSLNAMSSLFNSLIDMSKLDVNAIRPSVKRVAIAGIFNDINLDFQTEARAKKLKLNVQKTNLLVYSDPQLLGRIIRNLVANAIEYTKKGHILLGCRRNGNYISIQVWDTGIGIPDGQRQAIFEEYHQLNQSKQKKNERSGLGLAIVARLSRLLNHEVSVNSYPGKGTVFSIKIARAEPVAPVRMVQQKSEPIQNGFALKHKHVLLIDDDELFLQQSAKLLRSWGIIAITASNKKQAMEIMTLANSLEQPKFDLIVTDYHLNELKTGLELLMDIRVMRHTATPAIILTGDTSIHYDMINEDIFLMYKPLRVAKLKSLMEYVLSKGAVHVPGSQNHGPTNQPPLSLN